MLFPENKNIFVPGEKIRDIKQGLDIVVSVCFEIMCVVLWIKTLSNIKEIFIRGKRIDPDNWSHWSWYNHISWIYQLDDERRRDKRHCKWPKTFHIHANEDHPEGSLLIRVTPYNSF